MIDAISTRRVVVAAALALAGAATLLPVCARAAQETWIVDNTTSIGGHPTTPFGSPTVVATPFGNGLRFDGNDGVTVNANAIVGASAFTIEMLLRPDANVVAPLDQPRILHIQSNLPNDHRATLEGRISGGQWYLDAFLRAPTASNPSTIANLTLIDSTKLHPAHRWYAYALVYDGAQMRVYLDGALELSGALAIAPLAAGQTSLGMRFNNVNFYSGDIAKVRFTTSALAAADLLSSRIPGDYDGSYYSPGGGINGGDLAVWGNQYGTPGPFPATGLNADGDQNARVDGNDFLTWQRRVGAAPPNFAPIPEPSGLALIAIAALPVMLANQERCFRNACGETPNTLLNVREK